jgi:glutamine amidotransferase
MCRLFAMSSGPTPARATFWLLDAPDSLAVQSHREPDGTGLGWLSADGHPHISKQPRAAYSDRTFAHEAHEICSSAMLAHIRFASTGSLLARNTHPFKQAGRLFAHNGVIEDLPVLDAELGDARTLVAGDTDSERFFALITKQTEAHGGSVADGIAAACQWIAATLPIFAINFVLQTPEGLWALRYPDTHELYVLERAPGSPMEHRSSLGSRISCQRGDEHPLVVVASERMDEDPQWRAMNSGELLHVSPTLDVTTTAILPGPPAHPLTLDQLGARARASQARPAP